jgi:hypothetical protein
VIASDEQPLRDRIDAQPPGRGNIRVVRDGRGGPIRDTSADHSVHHHRCQIQATDDVVEQVGDVQRLLELVQDNSQRKVERYRRRRRRRTVLVPCTRGTCDRETCAVAEHAADGVRIGDEEGQRALRGRDALREIIPGRSAAAVHKTLRRVAAQHAYVTSSRNLPNSWKLANEQHGRRVEDGDANRNVKPSRRATSVGSTRN